MDNAQIVDGLRSGDANAFSLAWAAFRTRIYGFLLRMSRRPEVADDLLQETFVKLARAAPKLAPDTRLDAWLFTVARNAYRSHRRWEVLDLSRFVATEADAAEPSGASARLDVEVLERALLALPEAERELLLLVGVEGLEQDAVADMLKLRPDALRKRLSRARAMFQQRLAKIEGAPR